MKMENLVKFFKKGYDLLGILSKAFLTCWLFLMFVMMILDFAKII